MKSLKIISVTLVLTLITMQGIADEYVVRSGDSVRKISIKQGFKGDDQAIYAEVSRS